MNLCFTNYTSSYLRHRLSCLAIMLLCTVAGYAQDRTISGTITSTENGDPLPGVNVIVKGTTVGTVTNIDGNYRLQVPEDESTLQFSFIGYVTQEVEIGNQTTIDLALESDLQSLDEVVVVGYGEQSERFNTQQVSQVNARELENQPVVNVQELLQGRAAGVQMVGTSGVLGARSNIRIRGASSIGAGNQPLYVIDGVPLNDGEYSNTLGAEALNPLQNLNPNEIESINVLKDAAAVAIYGSRGANGVVLITTKQGNFNQETTISLDYYTGFSEATSFFDMMSADQYREFESAYETAQNPDEPAVTPADFPQGSFDWPGAVLQTGRINQYGLSATGGSEKTTFYVGGTYYNEEAFTIGNAVDKLNVRLNLDHQATDKLRFGLNLGLSALDNDRISSDNSTYAPLTSAYLQVPYVEAFEEDGTYARTGFVANVLAIEDLSTRELISRRNTGNFNVEYDLLDGLSLRTQFGVDLVQTEETTRDPDIVSAGGYGYKRIIQDNKWLNTTTLQFGRDLSEQHYLGVLLGGSYETSDINRIAVEGSGFVSDQLPNVVSAATPSLTSADAAKWALVSQFARVNYRFLNRYLIEGNVRRDGSSRFGSENRYGIFWAASVGWILSDEAFMEGIGFIDNLKLTASYGTSGNDRIGELNPFNNRYYPSLGLYEGGVLGDYAGIPGIVPLQPTNNNLQWEETTQLDVGISAQMLDSRLTFEANYYIKNTDNLLLETTLPYTTGFADINSNTGELENRGVDLMIGGDIVRNEDLSWSANLNVGYLENEVIDLPDDQIEDEPDFIEGTASQRAIEGQSINTFYLIRYKGVNPQTGDAEWLDANGEVTTAPTPADRVIVGSAIPNWTGGLTNTLRYRGLELNFLFNFVSGNKIFRGGRRFTENAGSGFNYSADLLDYWTTPGDDAFFPALGSPTAATFAQRSTAQLEDGDFIRLRTATLSYNVPGSVLEGTNVLRTARVYVTGRNLLTFAKTDLEPEVNGFGNDPLGQGEAFFTPPQARTIIFGVSLGF